MKTNKILSKKILAGFSLLALTSISSCENESEFRSSSKVKKIEKVVKTEDAKKGSGSDSDALGNDNEELNETLGGDGVSTSAAISTSVANNSVWVVNSNGGVYKISLDKEAGYPTQEWSGTGSGGHRTFVTKIGLIIGQNGGHVYRAGDNVPEGPAEKILQAPGAGGGTRVCLVSYQIDDVDYIGGGYTGSDGQRTFFSLKIDESKPNKVDMASLKTFKAGGGEWGYSCSIDQARKYYWSKDNSTRGNISGVDLRTGKALALEMAPNGKHINTVGAEMNLASGSQSYSMTGDLLGNILSFSGGYTAAHDTLSDTIFITSLSSTQLTITKGDCLRNKVCADGDSAQFELKDVNYVRPLSSLNDGRIVGLSRGNTSDVTLISLVDPNDISKGIDVEVIKTVNGNAYMYADFTGAFSYAEEKSEKISFKSAEGFAPDKPITKLFIKWHNESGIPERFRGLEASIRCFMDGSEDGVKFEKITNMPVAGDGRKIKASSCVNKVYDTVELKITPDGSSVFSKTKSFDFIIQQ